MDELELQRNMLAYHFDCAEYCDQLYHRLWGICRHNHPKMDSYCGPLFNFLFILFMLEIIPDQLRQ